MKTILLLSAVLAGALAAGAANGAANIGVNKGANIGVNNGANNGANIGARAAPAAGPRCSGEAAAPGQLALALGKSTLMRLPEPVVHRSVGNPAVLQAMLVAPETLYLVGADVGSTNLIVQGRSGTCSVIEVAVGMDVAALQATLAAVLPDERDVKVSAAADTLVLSGSVTDGVALVRVLELASAYVRRPARAVVLRRDDDDERGGTGGGAPADASAGAGAAPAAGGGPRIVNLLAVSAPQQVMLEVKVAEVSKTLLDKLEAGLNLRLKGNEWTATLLSNFLTGTLKGGLNLAKSAANQLQLDGERQDNLVRVLAEPTVMAISGQEGSFLAGGKIFIPVAQDDNKVTLEEKEFGVGLRFTPTVLAGGRIHLKVAPEVSELSRDGIGISAGSVSGRAIMPLITTRRASTTVQLNDGQSFAIGGLIRNSQVSNLDALPVLGELPVLGTLFRSTDFQHDRTELVFIVTAHLVKPLPPGQVLPTDALQPASRAGLMIGGRMESAAAPLPSTAPSPPAGQPSGFQLK